MKFLILSKLHVEVIVSGNIVVQNQFFDSVSSAVKENIL